MILAIETPIKVESMKKTGLVFLLLTSCVVVNADSSICHFSSQYNIEADENRVIFALQDGSRYEFQRGNLVINNEQVILDSKQQNSVTGIYETTRRLIPEVAAVAAAAVELALKMTAFIITTFFGGDEEIHLELSQPINVLADKIRENITADRFNAEAMDQSFEAAFDKEFELMVSAAVDRYTQALGGAVTDFFSGDAGGIKALAERLDNMGEALESYVVEHTPELEAQAELLCQGFAQLDQYDDQLLGLEGYPVGGLIYKSEQDESDDGFF
jgi:hypothetical protein